MTNRRREVLKLILEGKCNKDIANALNIAVTTVKFHTHMLFMAYHVRNRYELMAKAGGENAPKRTQ